MRIQVRLNASLRRYVPEGASGSPFDFDVEQGSTVADVMGLLGVPAEQTHMATVDGEQVELSQAVVEGQEISLFPPLAGGS